MRTLMLTLSLFLVAAAPPPKVERIEPKAAAKLVAKDLAVLVDVREEAEIKAGMAAPALWFPSSRVTENEGAAFFAFLAKNVRPRQEVIFYCAVGGRAERAAQQARRFGYWAANMGGFAAWEKAGLPVKKGPVVAQAVRPPATPPQALRTHPAPPR